MNKLSLLPASFHKEAQQAARPILSEEAFRESIARQARMDPLIAGILAASIGIGGRLLSRPRDVFSSKLNAVDTRALEGEKLSLPIPVFSKEKDKKKLLAEKVANQPYRSKWEHPWYGGLMALSTLGGLGLGYAATDKILEKKRKKDLKDQVEEAKKQFQQALLANYDPASVPVKKAEEGNHLYHALEKIASFFCPEDGEDEGLKKASEDVARIVGRLASLYGVAAVPLMALSGVAAYKATKARSQEKLVEKALERRQRELAARRPLAISIEPQPVHLSRGELALG